MTNVEAYEQWKRNRDMYPDIYKNPPEPFDAYTAGWLGHAHAMYGKTIPAWHDEPTGDGLWMNYSNLQATAHIIDASTDRIKLPVWGRWFGPIPDDRAKGDAE